MQKSFRHVKGYKCHIINIFEDNGVELTTYKWWGKTKQRWYYITVESCLLCYSIAEL